LVVRSSSTSTPPQGFFNLAVSLATLVLHPLAGPSRARARSAARTGGILMRLSGLRGLQCGDSGDSLTFPVGSG
jgi:hypothetical protein